MPEAHSMPPWRGPAFALVAITAMAARADADALVETRAMQASTIAEIFVDREQIRVELEVGPADVATFANVLPDELYEKVAGRARPSKERLRTFFERDWMMQADGSPLPGRVAAVLPAKRVIRDEVTGEALANQPADAEFVIRITLHYALNSRPRTLTFRPPLNGNDATANIGFVCYHSGLPVNDFRYLPGELTLDLDWTDPWYSRFRHPNFRRQFDAPLSAYLYIGAYEVRKEIIVRPKDLQHWLDLGIGEGGIITADQQEDIKRRVAEFLAAKNPLTINGQTAGGQLDRIHFIRRTLRTTGIVEPPIDLDATSATLGVIFVYPVARLPDEVAMQWELFSPKIRSIPVVASDEAGGLPGKVTPEAPVLAWKNYLTSPSNPQMKNVALPPAEQSVTVPLISVICGGLWLITLVVLVRQRSRGGAVSRPTLAASIAVLAAGLVALPFAKVAIFNPVSERAPLSADAAEELFSVLLRNVYHSFDHHDENLIYDRLAKSISGELLSDVYLTTRKSIEVKRQGGMRISVKEVVITELEPMDEFGGESKFRCRWQVAGWIGHWGHVHRRANEHVALVTVAPRDGRWKITGLEMLEEQPVKPPRDAGTRQASSTFPT